MENKKLVSVPYNLIINIRQNIGNQNIFYPENIDFSFLNMNFPGKFNLTGVIKKSIDKDKKSFKCIYRDWQNQQNFQWILSEGAYVTPIQSIVNNDDGYTVMLFYQKEI